MTIRSREFFGALYDYCDGLVELRALPSTARQFFNRTDFDGMATFCQGHAEDLYFGVATRKSDRDGSLENCAQLPALFVDIDAKNEVPQMGNLLDACQCPPSIVINSGGGQHAYWLLREPLDLAEDRDEAYRLLRGLAAAVGGDPAAAEPARILRIPNTVNRKYSPARRVTVQTFDPDRRYNPSDFDWLPNQVNMQTPNHEALDLSKPVGHGGRNDALYRLGRSLRANNVQNAVIGATLRATNNDRSAFESPLPEAEVEQVVANVLSQPNRSDFDGEVRTGSNLPDRDIGMDDGQSNEEQHTRRVEAAVNRERANREARRLIDAEERGKVELPKFLTLRELLAEPDPPTSYRIDGWQPRGAKVILSAAFKTGKTSAIDNLLRSLVDGDPFLGRYPVAPIDGTVLVLDFEMSRHQMKAWLRDQSVRQQDRVISVPMKGLASSFDIRISDVRAEWAAKFQQLGVAYPIIDCLRPILDALGMDENHEAGQFLVAFDALLHEAGIDEGLIVHHMGHQGERSRGDSRLRDWPDVEWRMVREGDDPNGDRFISAYGRDVDIPEQRLAFDPVTRHLTVDGGSRHDEKLAEALDDVYQALEASTEGMSGRAIEERLSGRHPRADVRGAVKLGVRRGRIATSPGSHNAVTHTLIPEYAAVRRECAGAVVSVCASAIETGAHSRLTAGREIDPARGALDLDREDDMRQEEL